MRRLSIATSVSTALLGLTVVLTLIAAIGVAALYSSRQHYEDRLDDALSLKASAGKLLAAGVVEEATLRTTSGPGASKAREPARRAFALALREARTLARDDTRSAELVTRAAVAQAALRAAPGARGDPLAGRTALAELNSRQRERVLDARADARRSSRRALVAIVAGGVLALLATLILVATLVARMRRPLDDLVDASERLAEGETGVRVDAREGPGELQALGRSFNAMAVDLETASARVEAERRRLAVTVQSLGDALVITSADGRVQSVNPRAVALVPELAPGTQIGADDGQQAPPAPLADALASEVTVQRGGRTLAVTAARMEGDEGIVWTVRDVSERARLEQLKSEFVATASHELRSPLTSIKGFVELLAAGKGLDSRQREFLDIVLVSTNRLVDLVNDLLDVARVEAGRIEISRRPVELADVVSDVATLLRPRLEAKGQRLELELPEGLPRALADPSRLRQILINLMTNAHLYTGEGGRVRVAAAEDHGSLVLSVADTGRGMNSEQLEHVFDRFYRGTDGSGQPGTGLGLAIVRSLVDLHHGTIDVTSEPGKGTTFTVRLPRAVERGDRPTGREVIAGRRVLVLDDEPQIAQLIAERLAPYGVETEIVNDGAAALKRLREEHFDALTLDILMPGMGGFEVLRRLRADPELADLPVVIVSVFSGREALSGEWVVSKPINASELADALGAAVLAGRVRVLAVGRLDVREKLTATLEELGIEHEWSDSPARASELCRTRRYEVALVDAGLPDAADAIAALQLRGRRLRRSVVIFSSGGESPGMARLDAEPVAIEDAGAVVLGLLSDDIVAG